MRSLIGYVMLFTSRNIRTTLDGLELKAKTCPGMLCVMYTSPSCNCTPF